MRRQALAEPALGCLGMSVFLTRGLAQWLRVMQIAPAPAPAQTPLLRKEPMLNGGALAGVLKTEIVRILATMVMTLEQENAYVY